MDPEVETVPLPEWPVGPPKSARSRRTIALDSETVERLREQHWNAQLLERDFAGNAYDDQDLVFCDELGRPYHPQRLTEWFSRHRKTAGLTGSLHILRHTAITLMLTSGIPVHVVAARVGDTPATVLSTYAHLLPQSDEIAAERVAAALSV